MLATTGRIFFVAFFVLFATTFYVRLRRLESEAIQSVIKLFALSVTLIVVQPILKASSVLNDSPLLFQILVLVAQEYGIVFWYLATDQMINNKEYQSITTSRVFIFSSIIATVVAFSRYLSNNSASFSDNKAGAISSPYFVSNMLHYGLLLFVGLLIWNIYLTSLRGRRQPHWIILTYLVLVAQTILCVGVACIWVNVALSYYHGHTYSSTLNAIYHFCKLSYAVLVLLTVLGIGAIKGLSSKLEASLQRKALFIRKELCYVHTLLSKIVPVAIIDDDNFDEKENDDLLLEISDADEVITSQKKHAASPKEYAKQLRTYTDENVMFNKPGKFSPTMRKNKQKFFLSVAKHLRSLNNNDDNSENRVKSMSSNSRDDGITYNI